MSRPVKLGTLTTVFALCLGLAIGTFTFVLAPHPQAQAQPSQAIISYPPVYQPAAAVLTTTCTTTACPTFILNGACTGTVRVSGATTVNIVTKISPDGGTNYYQITPLVVGVAANGTITTNAIAANGYYSITTATANRVRFEVGTLTGASVSIKFQTSTGCISQAM